MNVREEDDDELIGIHLKKSALALSLVMLAACMPYSSMSSPDPDMRLDGDEPEGYPRTFVVHYKGSCYRATESWSKETEAIRGHTLWIKRETREDVACPQAPQ
ncbi:MULTISPECIES: hypothetical protein [Pseudomonas syringae group]|uniref:hypothetical protein n=1 Tax=Pseudomonas syringae group TaxID=136849 RepID=UPI001F1226BC|nr:hypothetical protein [Pseudomonas viridiflava]MEE4183557.1 hypothetical protein [Pseudomonas viridiflava]